MTMILDTATPARSAGAGEQDDETADDLLLEQGALAHEQADSDDADATRKPKRRSKARPAPELSASGRDAEWS